MCVFFFPDHLGVMRNYFFLGHSLTQGLAVVQENRERLTQHLYPRKAGTTSRSLSSFLAYHIYIYIYKYIDTYLQSIYMILYDSYLQRHIHFIHFHFYIEHWRLGQLANSAGRCCTVPKMSNCWRGQEGLLCCCCITSKLSPIRLMEDGSPNPPNTVAHKLKDLQRFFKVSSQI